MRAHMVTNLYRCILVYKHVTYILIAYNQTIPTNVIAF